MGKSSSGSERIISFKASRCGLVHKPLEHLLEGHDHEQETSRADPRFESGGFASGRQSSAWQASLGGVSAVLDT